MFKQVSTAVLILAAAAGRGQNESSWVAIGADGRLSYRTDSLGNRIPDFSNVGYHGGDAEIPTVSVQAEVSPAPGDAGARIQAAIDAVSQRPADARGWRGAVLIHRGRYDIAGSIYVRTGGVVLRGEGYEANGTLLVATGRKQRSLIIVSPEPGGGRRAGEDDGASSQETPEGSSHREITDAYVPVGAHTFHVASSAGLSVGEEIVVHRPSTALWIHTIGMDRIPMAANGSTVQWRPGTKDLFFSRVITAIAGNEIRVDAPIVCALDRRFGGGQVITGLPVRSVREVGIENLAGDSAYKSATDERHGWVFVDLVDARNAWVRYVLCRHFGYSCVYVRKPCKWVTVDHCACLDAISQIIGGRRYSFAVDGQLTLVEHCFSRNGRHDFVMHALAAGPNVFFDCRAQDSHADSGPHHRWSVGVLYDNLVLSGSSGKSGGQLNIRNRGNSGTGHGWAGANQVAWNCRADGMIVENPPTAQNWAIGCVTPSAHGNGDWDQRGKPVAPASLYLAQLQERHAASHTP